LVLVTLVADGAPVDLTGATLAAQARLSVTTGVALTGVVAIVDAAAGQLSVRWPGDDVRTLLAGEPTWAGVWDLQMTVAPDEPVTILAGRLTAEMDVTR
jgi:hypothetical protein